MSVMTFGQYRGLQNNLEKGGSWRSCNTEEIEVGSIGTDVFWDEEDEREGYSKDT